MKLAAAMLIVAIAMLQLATPEPAPPQKAPYTYVALAGTPLFDGTVDGTNCLALWPRLVTHPHWTLSMRDTEWTVLDGLLDRGSISIAEDGDVWLERRPNWELAYRRFYLTEAELREIRGLDRLACRERRPTRDHAHTYYVTYGAAISGSDLAHAAPIPADSEMGAVIDRILRDANARYLAARAATARRELQLVLVVPRGKQPYRLEVTHGVLTLSRGATELYRHDLATEELVDLADADLSEPWSSTVSEYGTARGQLIEGANRRDIEFDSEYLPLAFPHLGQAVTDVIDADCAARGCPHGIGVSGGGPATLVPP